MVWVWPIVRVCPIVLVWPGVAPVCTGGRDGLYLYLTYCGTIGNGIWVVSFWWKRSTLGSIGNQRVYVTSTEGPEYLMGGRPRV